MQASPVPLFRWDGEAGGPTSAHVPRTGLRPVLLLLLRSSGPTVLPVRLACRRGKRKQDIFLGVRDRAGPSRPGSIGNVLANSWVAPLHTRKARIPTPRALRGVAMALRAWRARGIRSASGVSIGAKAGMVLIEPGLDGPVRSATLLKIRRFLPRVTKSAGRGGQGAHWSEVRGGGWAAGPSGGHERKWAPCPPRPSATQREGEA